MTPVARTVTTHLLVAALLTLVAALLTLVGGVVRVPQAQAAFPGRNGALLVSGSARPSTCNRPIPKLARSARSHVQVDPRFLSRGMAWASDEEPPPCEGTYSPSALFLARVGSPTLERLRVMLHSTLGSFSADGRQIALKYEWGTDLAVMPVARNARLRWRGPPRLANESATAPAWSPSGARLVVESYGRGLVSYPSVGGKGRVLSDGVAPSWSSQGRIAFLRVDDWGTPSLYVMDGDGSDVRSLTLVTPRLMGSPQPGQWPRPDWSPDGSSIVFTGSVSRSRHQSEAAMYTISVTTGVVRRITAYWFGDYYYALDRVVWSPDGRSIAFTDPYGRGVYSVPSRPARPVAANRWRRVVSNADLLDWQALPTRRSGR